MQIYYDEFAFFLHFEFAAGCARISTDTDQLYFLKFSEFLFDIMFPKRLSILTNV